VVLREELRSSSLRATAQANKVVVFDYKKTYNYEIRFEQLEAQKKKEIE